VTTVNEALMLLVDPCGPLTVTEYMVSVSVKEAASVLWLADVAPKMGMPFFFHW
jgi:hypothetical protein